MNKGYEIKVPFKSLQGKIISGYVNVRPHAKEIIKNMSRHFDVIIFTAGNQCYADPILDYLDPEKKIQHRLYRDSCTMVNNQLFVKDLRILGRKMENVVLVDNAPYSYMMQLNNGIPILNYIKGKDDDQLVKLEPYLMGLLDVEDVRTVNASIFRLTEYHRYDSYDKLIQELYGKWL
jgi:CTD small phosphatase-like protein 2